jgi:hypothetical protein
MSLITFAAPTQPVRENVQAVKMFIGNDRIDRVYPDNDGTVVVTFKRDGRCIRPRQMRFASWEDYHRARRCVRDPDSGIDNCQA